MADAVLLRAARSRNARWLCGVVGEVIDGAALEWRGHAQLTSAPPAGLALALLLEIIREADSAGSLR